MCEQLESVNVIFKLGNVGKCDLSDFAHGIVCLVVFGKHFQENRETKPQSKATVGTSSPILNSEQQYFLYFNC